MRAANIGHQAPELSRFLLNDGTSQVRHNFFGLRSKCLTIKPNVNWLKDCDQIVRVQDITTASVNTEFRDDFLNDFLFPLLPLPSLSFLVIICLSDIFHYDENANMFCFIVLFTHDEEDAQVPHT